MSVEAANKDKAAGLAPLADVEWPDELGDMLGGFAGRLNVYRTMAHHPALLRAWGDLRDHVVMHSALGLEKLEVVILRTGHRLGSDYEWQHHVDRARACGFSDTRIASIRGGTEGMAEDDALLCRAVDALFDNAALDSETLSEMSKAHGTRSVLDLMATVGFYSTLGFILNSFHTPLDDDVSARLAARPFTATGAD